MRLKKLRLENFTNYGFLDYEAGSSLNIFFGKNAQGKSNLLDAIFYLSRASTSRFNQDIEVLKWNSQYFKIKGFIENRTGDREIAISFMNGKKALFIDGIKTEKISEVLGLFTVVLFSPDDLYLVKGGPEIRRKYLDDELIQTDIFYYHQSQKYKKLLVQRNNCLKGIRKGNIKESMLDVWDIQLAEAGTNIINKRIEMMEKLKPLARLAQRKLTEGLEELEIEYVCSVRDVPNNRYEKIDKEKYSLSLISAREEDIIRGYSTKGPHRDDFLITLNKNSAKSYASQGQQRTIALSLKIAELEFIKSEKGEYPVLLLDDVLSELDESRRNKLLAMVSEKIQTFITCTEIDVLNNSFARIFEIIDGTVTPLEQMMK